MSQPTTEIPQAVTVTQTFSRRGVGFLWNKRAELDPGQVAILNSLYNNRKKGSVECQQTITYKLSRSKAGQLGYGRYYGSKGSLETLEKECRGTICRDYYHDLDIVNCHPVLLTQFARAEYEKDLPEVDAYVANRDLYLSKTGLSRDDAKTEVIKILYGGTTKIEFLQALSREVREFSKFLAGREEYSELWAAVQKEDNKYGTFLSYILQTIERECMMTIRSYLESQGWSVDVLAYDGVMIRKREGVAVTPELLRAVEVCVFETNGYEVSIVNKEFSYFEVPSVDEEIVKGVTKSAYEEMKAQFEQTHFLHGPTGYVGQVTPNGEITFMKTDHARSVLLNGWIFKHSEKFGDYTPFFEIWAKDPTRRLVWSIDMKPSGDPTVFSPPMTWAYLAGESPSDPVPYLQLFHRLLDSLIPRADMRQFVLEWLAHILQKPFENPKCGVILTGGKGCGKDTLGDFFSQWVLGYRYAVNYDSNEQFWAPHDTGRMNKLFVKLEEAAGFLNKQHESTLKARLTGDISTFNPKGTKEVVAANYNRYFMTTNDYNPVATDKEERRFMIIACSDALIGKMDFWRELRGLLFTPTGGRAIADYLLGLEIGVFPRPLIISELAEMIAESQESSEDRFLTAWDGAEVGASELFALYTTYCQEKQLPACKSSKSFGMRLVKPVATGKVVKRVLDGCSLYSKP